MITNPELRTKVKHASLVSKQSTTGYFMWICFMVSGVFFVLFSGVDLLLKCRADATFAFSGTNVCRAFFSVDGFVAIASIAIFYLVYGVVTILLGKKRIKFLDFKMVCLESARRLQGIGFLTALSLTVIRLVLQAYGFFVYGILPTVDLDKSVDTNYLWFVGISITNFLAIPLAAYWFLNSSRNIGFARRIVSICVFLLVLVDVAATGRRALLIVIIVCGTFWWARRTKIGATHVVAMAVVIGGFVAFASGFSLLREEIESVSWEVGRDASVMQLAMSRLYASPTDVATLIDAAGQNIERRDHQWQWIFELLTVQRDRDPLHGEAFQFALLANIPRVFWKTKRDELRFVDDEEYVNVRAGLVPGDRASSVVGFGVADFGPLLGPVLYGTAFALCLWIVEAVILANCASSLLWVFAFGVGLSLATNVEIDLIGVLRSIFLSFVVLVLICVLSIIKAGIKNQFTT